MATGTLAELRHLAAVSVDAVLTGARPDLSRVPGVTHLRVEGSRRAAAGAAAALGLGLAVLAIVTAAIVLAIGRVPEARFGVGESTYPALALVAPAGVFMAVGLFASQMAPTRRQASQLAAAAFDVAFLLRVVSNSDPGQWLTSLGWVQHLHPLTGSSAPPLVPLVLLTAGLADGAVALAGERDVGAGLLAARDSAQPRTTLLAIRWG